MRQTTSLKISMEYSGILRVLTTLTRYLPVSVEFSRRIPNIRLKKRGPLRYYLWYDRQVLLTLVTSFYLSLLFMHEFEIMKVIFVIWILCHGCIPCIILSNFCCSEGWIMCVKTHNFEVISILVWLKYHEHIV